MKKKAILCSLALFAILFCSACGTEAPTTSNSAADPAPQSTPKLDIPDEQELIRTYTDELSKLTNSSIVSTQYESYKPDEIADDLDLIINMDDGRTLKVSMMHMNSWSVVSIKNKNNSHSYYLGEGVDDLAFSGIDFYEYSTDTLIPKENFQTKNKLKKITFLSPSHWKKSKTETGYSFYNNTATQHYIMFFCSKVPSASSLDQAWESLDSIFNNYSLDEKKDVKIGGRDGKQWSFSYESDNGTNYNAIYSMVIDKKIAYSFMVMTPWVLDDTVFNAMLESVEWKNSSKSNMGFKSNDKHIYNMHTFSDAIQISYNECHELGLRIADIWHDAIMKESDTNTIEYTYDTENKKYRDYNSALSCYMQSDEYKKYKDNITTTKNNLLNLYTQLNDLPVEFSNIKKYIKEIYDTYAAYQSSLLTPNGTYDKFVESVNGSTNITVLCDTLNALIPEYEKKNYSFKDEDLYVSFYYGLRYGKFTGSFSNGNINGNGTFISTNTDDTTWTYTGNFKDGHFSGKGKSQWSNSSSYEGEYKNDRMNGQGTYIWSDGSSYKGEYKNGCMNGQGTYISSDGTVYKGTFEDNKFISQ